MILTALLFCFASAGLTLIITDGSIAQPLRDYVIDHLSSNLKSISGWIDDRIDLISRSQFNSRVFACFAAIILVTLYSIRFCFSLSRKLLLDKLPDGIECHQCMGFWSGMICAILLWIGSFGTVLCCGFAASFLAPLFSSIMVYIDSKSIISGGN